MYKITYAPKAKAGLKRLKESEPTSFKKAVKILNDLSLHPRTGIGHPEQLSGDRAGQWSRRITKKHRLVYEIYDEEVFVYILSAYGHYEDK